MTTIVTYAYAYISGQMDLCGDCAANPPSWVPSLGPVQQGQREGTCEACEIGDDRIEALSQEAGAAGDMEQVEICRGALSGDAAARRECARVIADAQEAQR